jgi:hypothetical protein
VESEIKGVIQKWQETAKGGQGERLLHLSKVVDAIFVQNPAQILVNQ